MTVPRLHLVTDDAVLRGDGFVGIARRVLGAYGAAVALHLRGHGLSGRELHDIASALAGAAVSGGASAAGVRGRAVTYGGQSPVLLNDRVDIAIMTRAAGVQLGRRSLPVVSARRLLGGAALIGYSAHAAGEAAAAVRDGADFVVVGAVYATESHPGAAAAGPGLIRDTAHRIAAPVVAIGGITPERVPEVLAAGAGGVAVLGGVWRARDPMASVAEYLNALGDRPAPERVQ